MFRLVKVVIVLSLILVVGCVSPSAQLDPMVEIADDKGYITGIFSGAGKSVGFGITNLDTGEEFFLPFYVKTYADIAPYATPKKPENIPMIEVPPGHYELSYWQIYESAFNSTGPKNMLGGKTREFDVEAGGVFFVGKYETAGNSYAFYVSRKPISLSEVVEKVVGRYPNVKPETITISSFFERKM